MSSQNESEDILNSPQQRIDAFIEAALPPAADHRSGSLEEAESIRGADPNIATVDVRVAAMLGEVDALSKLIRKDPALATGAGGPRNWDPLLYLCYSRYLRLDLKRGPGFVECAKQLLRHGADPNTSWTDPAAPPGVRQSAVYGAAGIANHVELTRLLLEAGANPNDGETAYHSAEHDGVPCAELLFQHGLDDLGKSIMVRHKLDYDDLEGVRRLLELGANSNLIQPFGKTGLHQAVFRNRGPEYFDLLFAHGADPNISNSSGKTPYALAARTGNTTAMESLRDHGAETTLEPTDQFLADCASGDEEAVKQITSRQPDLVHSLSDEDRGALVEAAARGNTTGVRLMLDAGFDVDTRGQVWKETATHRAAIDGHLETVRLLVERGADLTLRDASYQSSPLGWAAHGEQDDVLAFLLTDPSKLDLRDAIEFGSAERARELLGDADVDAAFGGGEPGVLLRAAAHGGHLELVRVLLERGADRRRRNGQGLTALDYARQQGHDKVVELLESDPD